MASIPKKVEFSTNIAPSAPKDKYELLNVAVEGKFTEIYKAKLKNDSTDKFFAIKIIKKFELTEREVFAFEKLNGMRHIIKFFDILQEEKKIFSIVMEHCIADFNEILISKRIVVGVPEKKTILSHFLRGLDAIHSKKIMHRDIKSANLLLSYDGYVKISDFGNACQGPPIYADRSTIFTDQKVSVHYRAPELLLGDRKYSERIDLWAAGCVAYEIWANEVLFPGDNQKHQLEKISEVCGFISEDIWSAVRTLNDYEDYLKTTSYRYKSESRLIDKLQLVTRDAGVIDLIMSLLNINPYKRESAEILLMHNIFDVESKPPPAYNLFPFKMLVEIWPRTAVIPNQYERLALD